MKNEKIKGRSRVVTLGKKDWFETQSGAKFPIKSKPMIFSDMQEEFNLALVDIQKVEGQRTIKAEEFDLDEYTKTVLSYLDLFYDIVTTVSKFNGYDIDKEFIKANMSHEDPYWYINSVASGKPLYTVDDLIEKKKK